MNANLAKADLPFFSSPVPHIGHRTVSYWRLGEQVTGGRWFEIYRAAPKSLAAHSAFDYAIKLINPHLNAEDTSSAVELLGREAAATESIQHHGVVPLLDAELDQPDFFLVQPWIAGGTLSKFLAVANDISLIRCLWIFRQVAEAIAAAHDKRRVYYGLDPAHVLLGSGGRVMLIGWSHSHVDGQQTELPIDQFRFAQYAAPECFNGEGTAQRASDIYSLGVFVYQVLSKVVPFRRSTVEQLIRDRREKRPVDLIRLQPAVPARLSRLVAEMLAVNPAARPSIRDVLDNLISVEIENLENPALVQL